MAELVIGISDLRVTNNPADSMVTYALGSCIAVAVYDPEGAGVLRRNTTRRQPA